MTAEKKKLKVDQKRKLLLILRITVLLGAVIYLIFLVYTNYFISKNKLVLYFSTNDANYLVVEKREIEPEVEDYYLKLFRELKTGPKNKELKKTIPKETELLDYNLKNKTITLNFNLALKNNHWGGSTGELLTVYSIVNTYTHLDEIEYVKILLEGQAVETLVGHLDLSQALMYNQKLTKGS
ncbi:MAG: GerMN domain-containing protein [Bacillota bacterium]